MTDCYTSYPEYHSNKNCSDKNYIHQINFLIFKVSEYVFAVYFYNKKKEFYYHNKEKQLAYCICNFICKFEE